MRSGQILRFRQNLVLIPQFFHEQLKVVVKGLMQSQHPLTHFPESPVFPVGGINDDLERGVFPFLVLIPFFPVGSRLLEVFAQGTVLPMRLAPPRTSPPARGIAAPPPLARHDADDRLSQVRF